LEDLPVEPGYVGKARGVFRCAIRVGDRVNPLERVSDNSLALRRQPAGVSRSCPGHGHRLFPEEIRPDEKSDPGQLVVKVRIAACLISLGRRRPGT
jgi:hypothetical protein